ncbi:MAG: hypothetical protein B6D56_02600 [Candidatus Omnitrophica bacterium 4484_70.1]|nr:MAG: hypothetical protein B6D56_02600 [Candidatus Omnitrophica bacterium 4484_70.1]
MKGNSLVKLGLKKRLWIAFSFATFFPLSLLLYYLINFKTLSWFAVGVTAFIIFLGWWFVFNVFSSILRIQNKSFKTLEYIKEGERYFKEIEIEDEVQKLDMVFNILSSKVKESVEELRKVSFKTEELNRAIAQKVNIFSTILQVHSLFSQGSSVQSILQFLIERLREILASKTVMLFLKKKNQGYNYFCCGISASLVEEVLKRDDFLSSLKEEKYEVVDKNHPKEKFAFHKEILNIKNILIYSITSSQRNIGVIVVGNSLDDFAFSEEDFETIKLFAHQIGILWEHSLLSQKIEDMEIYDSLTGVYNEKFLLERLEEEIKRAAVYQRPCGFILFRIDNYFSLQNELGLVKIEKVLKRTVNEIKGNIRSIDIIGRIGEEKIGVILIEKNKRQSKEVASQLKEKLESLPDFNCKISFAVAESPLDGENASQLFRQANSYLDSSS